MVARRDPKPRPEHLKRARAFLEKQPLLDAAAALALEVPLARELAKLARDWRDEVKRVRRFAHGSCCPICGWEPSRCQCRRPH